MYMDILWVLKYALVESRINDQRGWLENCQPLYEIGIVITIPEKGASDSRAS
jgi:hypothetical protein